jgi:hypothetical protein
MSHCPSVEPSLTIATWSGSTVWLITDLMVSSMNSASFFAGVTSTWLYDSAFRL